MSHQQDEISVIEPGAGALVDVLGAPIVIKSAGRGDQLFFADHPMPPGFGVPLHVHEDEDELFYIPRGRDHAVWSSMARRSRGRAPSSIFRGACRMASAISAPGRRA